MQLTEKQQQNENFLNALYTKCHEDESFKNRLVSNPEATIKEIFPNFSVNGGKKLVVEDQTDSNNVYINIPAKLDLENAELTDEQMELVAGGFFCIHIGDIDIEIH